MSTLILTVLIAAVACRSAQQHSILVTATLVALAMIHGMPGPDESNYILIGLQVTLDALICLVPAYVWYRYHRREFSRFLQIISIKKGHESNA